MGGQQAAGRRPPRGAHRAPRPRAAVDDRHAGDGEAHVAARRGARRPHGVEHPYRGRARRGRRRRLVQRVSAQRRRPDVLRQLARVLPRFGLPPRPRDADWRAQRRRQQRLAVGPHLREDVGRRGRAPEAEGPVRRPHRLGPPLHPPPHVQELRHLARPPLRAHVPPLRRRAAGRRAHAREGPEASPDGGVGLAVDDPRGHDARHPGPMMRSGEMTQASPVQ
mmetsp:Transcript_98100/g.274611  ORF Transcript_98100/g.274611 Transcript_98100/m.274611 type:complete len:222 (+) Transcript_98100:1454-2119(+)